MSGLKSFAKMIKSNILTVTLIALVVIIATASTSIAYFSDNKEMANVFTAGNVYISLTEAAVKSDGTGNLVEDTSTPRVQGVAIDSAEGVTNDYGTLFPGKTMHKDPTIQNTGDDPAWIAAKIIITDGSGDINKLYGYENSQMIDIKDMLDGAPDTTLLGGSARVGLWNGIEDVRYNDMHAMVQVADTTNGVYEFYFFLNAALLPGEEIVLFDTMTIDPTFSNAQMQERANLEITVQAFAVQTYGFESSYAAMCRAFPQYFNKVAPAQSDAQ